MSKSSLLIVTLAATAMLAGCAEKTPTPAQTAAKNSGEPATAVTPEGDRAAPRAGTLPPLARRLGSDAPAADDSAAGEHRWGPGERPNREEMMQRRDERRQEMLDKFDADHDGELSDTERTAARAARVTGMIERTDADHDGKLSKTELEAMRGGRRGGPDFATLDVDHDGFVTAAEMTAGTPRPFRDRGPDDRGDDAPAPPAK